MSDTETEVNPEWVSLDLPLECPNCGYDGDNIVADVDEKDDDGRALKAKMDCWECDHKWDYERDTDE